LAGLPFRINAEERTLRVPLQFFTASEAKVISAACERIFPSDESGPGAEEAAVIIYIDRQLAGPYGRDRYRYNKPPFVDSVPEHGYQGKENPQEIYRDGLAQLGSDFADLEVGQQDERLRSMETTIFFRMLRTHTLEGMFSDPMHGGNAGLIGWQLIGYPGPVMTYRDEIDKHYGEAFRRSPVSLEDVIGRKVKGWEEERE
ncbi:MAG TPA: gluconate 2-dehydrogenase subunit 3 family protein, partial [Blastocatellia bacterium]